MHVQAGSDRQLLHQVVAAASPSDRQLAVTGVFDAALEDRNSWPGQRPSRTVRETRLAPGGGRRGRRRMGGQGGGGRFEHKAARSEQPFSCSVSSCYERNLLTRFMASSWPRSARQKPISGTDAAQLARDLQRDLQKRWTQVLVEEQRNWSTTSISTRSRLIHRIWF